MVKRVIIAGGGHIGARLAQALEERFQVKVIERNVVHQPSGCRNS
jgi:trk system potassium uptake protein TrkA